MAFDLRALLSQDDFDCLEFDDVALLDKAQRQAVVKSMDQILDFFLKTVDYQHIVRPKDVAFRRDLWAWGYSKLTTATSDNANLDFLLDTTASCLEYFYPSACHQSRMCTGTATGAAILVDDLVEKPGGLEQFNHFSQRYLRGLPQPDGLCEALADGIKDCDEFYGSKNPRAGSFDVMGWLAGIDACCQEARMARELPGQFVIQDSRNGRTEWSVEKLPYYHRGLTGFPNCYIMPIFKPSHDIEVPLDLWISGIPDLIQFICLGNDLFSFRKEVLALENFNYLSLITRAKRQAGRTSTFDSNDGFWTFRDTLHEAFDQLERCTVALDKLFISFAESVSEAARTQVDIIGQIKKTNRTSNIDRETVENARLAAKYWGEFRQGYFAWHINAPRYRLDSVRATLTETPDTKHITPAVAVASTAQEYAHVNPSL